MVCIFCCQAETNIHSPPLCFDCKNDVFKIIKRSRTLLTNPNEIGNSVLLFFLHRFDNERINHIKGNGKFVIQKKENYLENQNPVSENYIALDISNYQNGMYFQNFFISFE